MLSLNIVLALLACLCLEQSAPSQNPARQSCLDCHDGPVEAKQILSPALRLHESVHKDLDCTDCHESFSMDDLNIDAVNPHGAHQDPVNCTDCHDNAGEAYLRHGRLIVGTDPDIPQCWSCHGTHDILPATDRDSRVHPVNLSNTCSSCHTDVDLVKKHDTLRREPIELYKRSVHGSVSTDGRVAAATCNDCHSSAGDDGKRTAHRVFSANDPESTIYHFSIPDTCGRCHASVTKDYWEGVHGQRVRQGDLDAPVCTHCHGEHGIVSPSDPRSPVSAARVAEATCAPCHDSQVLNESYGIPAGRLRSYIDSYHGLKSKAGNVHVANCASCHGAHRILPHTDPSSSIYPSNLTATCGECHPGISEALANTPIHETAAGKRVGWPGFFSVLYMWVIAVTIGLMILHNLADVLRHIRNIKKRPYIIRLTISETAQHWLLMSSFTALVLSGFSLRFSENWWVRFLFGWGSGEGFVIRGTVHRIAAIAFMVCIVWHLFYLTSRRGRRMLRDMLPNRRDAIHVKENVQYFLGLRAEKPRFMRFSYMEKAEYWALAWGAVIMVVTGVALWFDNYFVAEWGLPKGLLDVFQVIHYYEAWLATLAILVWHLYCTVFSPSVYPMNTAWVSGKMAEDVYTHEHPGQSDRD